MTSHCPDLVQALNKKWWGLLTHKYMTVHCPDLVQALNKKWWGLLTHKYMTSRYPDLVQALNKKWWGLNLFFYGSKVSMHIFTEKIYIMTKMVKICT
jgi:hypothetical protein